MSRGDYFERHLREASEDGLDWAGPLLRALDETLARRFSTPSSKRDVLMEAMSEMVARQGFASVRLGAVIEKAGLNQRGFYNHFTGKEQCFATAVARLLERLERESRGSLEMLIERLAGDPCAARILLVEIHALPEPSGDDRAGPRSFVALIERLLSAGEDAQETSGRAEGEQSRRLAAGALIEALRTDALQGRPGAMLAHAA